MDIATALILCRLLHFAAVLLLAGTSSFVLWAVPAELRQVANPALLRLAGVAAAVAILTTPAWLMLEAGNIGDGWSSTTDPGTLGAVLGASEFGQVWIWRLILALLLLVATVALPRKVKWAGLFAISALLLATLALVGHAAAERGLPGIAHRLNQGVHLFAAAAWVGALPPLWICLRHRRAAGLAPAAAKMLRRFSVSGHFAVAIVIATGFIETWLIVGGVPADLSSPYQLLLLAKIAIVAAMILIAIFNRYRAVPVMDAGDPAGLAALIRGTVAEIVLSIAVIALVSAFGTFDPS